MAEPPKPGTEFNGWKEIAQYLRVSVRTAQKFERERGLPVHRGAGIKSPVYATAMELDAWKADLNTTTPPGNGSGLGQANPTAVAPPPQRLAATRIFQSLSFWIVMITSGVSLFVLAAWHLYRIDQPINYQVEGDLLRTFDERGRLVWEYKLPGRPRPDAYKKTTPFQGDPTSPHERSGLFADIDDDGKAEFLFVYWPQIGDNSTVLYCFRPNGNLAWTTRAGRPLITVFSMPATCPGE